MCEANVARENIFLKMYGTGWYPPGVSAIIYNKLNFCSDFLTTVNFEALLLYF